MAKSEWDKAFNFCKLHSINNGIILLGELEARLKPLKKEDDYLIPEDRQYLDYLDTSMILNEMRENLLTEKEKIDKS